MTEQQQSQFFNPDLWIRFAYIVLFALLSALARCAVIALALIQFLLILITAEKNTNLCLLGNSIAIWTQQSYLFLTFAADEKPYPFQDWPTAEPAAADIDSGKDS